MSNAEHAADDQANSDPAAELHRAAERFRRVMAHAWMVRTFIKHCDEIDDHPELMGIVRAVFDMTRAIESRFETPPEYFRFARKKIGRLRTATAEFRDHAWKASTHTNFRQAVMSMEFAVEQLDGILEEVETLKPRQT